MAANICSVQTATCPSSVPASAKISSEECTVDLYYNTVFDVVQSPVSLGKSWSLTISLKKKFILKILELEIISKMIFLIFHYLRYRNHPVTFMKKFPHQFAFASFQ